MLLRCRCTTTLIATGQSTVASFSMTFSARRTVGSKTQLDTSFGALLIGGEVKLRVAGADVTVNGEVAKEALKNNNNFNKAGVSLRDGQTFARSANPRFGSTARPDRRFSDTD